ncbi:MAG: FxLYD domain-containing protein, partial [Mesotoga sp.]|uniref:FxLYD domain-containing protein n=1 Tax=Mesotoga sp. TaxID=2053577 RepID=UPI0026223271
ATVTEDDNTDQFDYDSAEVKILVPEIKELDILNEHDMEWDKTKEYSWIIDKSVTPQSLTLASGDSGTFNYTLVATRSVEETNVATFTGVATVTNTGNTTLTGIAISIVLKDNNGASIASFNTIITSLAPGNKQTISYSLKFDPSTFVGPFKVKAAAADGASDSFDTEQIVPSPNLTEIDENAYVQDTFDSFSVAGLTLLGNQDRDWSVTTASWTQSYSVSVANTGAAPGQYSLYNTADIFGKDTNTKYDTDNETVTINVPETVELEAQVEAEFFWDRFKSYSWQLVKEVTPDSITYDLDEFEKEIDYTITATRTLESDVSEHSYQGAVTVINSGLSEAKNVKLLIELQYYNGTSWTTIQTLPEVSLGSISAGSNKVHNFGPSAFTPIDVSAEHKVVVIASADAPANNADDFYSSSLGVTSNETTNATATLDDEFTYIPDGFQIVDTDPDPLPFPIELTDSSVVQFSITLRKFSFDGSGEITYVMGVDSYISATVSGYMEGTYPGWCIEVNVSGIEGPYTVVDIYEGGAPSTQMAEINYILNRFRDGDYSGVDYRHIQLAIWAIMEGSLDWSSWRTMFSPDVPDGDKPIVQAIVDTARDDFLPGCGDVVLISALSSNKQDLLLEAVLSCEVLEFTLENEATLVTETDELWDDAVVEIKLTPTDPEVWVGEETAWGGDYEGDGDRWWYYYDTEGPSTQAIYAGQKLIDEASVTYDQNSGTITIVLGPNMRLQTGSETVKIQGYAEGDLPTSNPVAGHFTYKGTDLVISVSPARYYAIHLDVEVKQ